MAAAINEQLIREVVEEVLGRLGPAKATAARSSVLDRPASAPPSVPINQAAVPENSRSACLRVWSIVARGVRVNPSASPLTPKRVIPLPVRAATRRGLAGV